MLFDFEKSGLGHPEEDLARLVNFYMLHNRRISRALTETTTNKKGLFALRFYKAFFLMHYYYKKHKNTASDLSKFQYFFWNHTITNLIEGKDSLTLEFIDEYLSIEKRLLNAQSLKEQNKYIR